MFFFDIFDQIVKLNSIIISSQTIGIIGGGPAGIATAIKLKQYNFEVLVFEATKYQQITVGEHLSAEVLHEFKKLKIPEALINNHSIPCTEVKNAWGNSEIHYNESIFNPFGNGYILSRPNFDETLLNHCETLGIKTFRGNRISGIEKTAKGWNLIHNSEKKHVDFVVDASGRNSKFSFENKPTKQSDDELIGITKHLSPINSTTTKKSYLLIESTPNGWWYTVQASNSNLVCTFMTDAKIWSKNKTNKESFWLEQLKVTNHTKSRLNDFNIHEKTYTQSAHSHLAKYITGENWLKVGDSAQSFDPLSSAGIIKGFKMGQLAADSIYSFFSEKKDSLKLYENEIKIQYKNYLVERDKYYKQEIRWMNNSFWYKRNLCIKEINHFTITPLSIVKIIDFNSEEKIGFLSSQLPEIDFIFLLENFQKHPTVKDAVEYYLQSKKLKSLHPLFIHAIESLKIIGIIK